MEQFPSGIHALARAGVIFLLDWAIFLLEYMPWRGQGHISVLENTCPARAGSFYFGLRYFPSEYMPMVGQGVIFLLNWAFSLLEYISTTGYLALKVISFLIGAICLLEYCPDVRAEGHYLPSGFWHSF
jgi:hypothetical protein